MSTTSRDVTKQINIMADNKKTHKGNTLNEIIGQWRYPHWIAFSCNSINTEWNKWEKKTTHMPLHHPHSPIPTHMFTVSHSLIVHPQPCGPLNVFSELPHSLYPNPYIPYKKKKDNGGRENGSKVPASAPALPWCQTDDGWLPQKTIQINGPGWHNTPPSLYPVAATHTQHPLPFKPLAEVYVEVRGLGKSQKSGRSFKFYC